MPGARGREVGTINEGESFQFDEKYEAWIVPDLNNANVLFATGK